MTAQARKYLTESEVSALMVAAKRRARNAKNGHRDAAMIRAAYVHGLRVSELVTLRWSQVDLKAGTLTVGRLKNGKPAAHPIPGDESRALRQIERDWPDNGGYVFVSERGGPMGDEAFRKMLGLAADEAGISRELVHPHALRHACGHKMANDGVTTRVIQDYLGHKNIAHTVVYTELVASKFEGIWNKRG